MTPLYFPKIASVFGGLTLPQGIWVNEIRIQELEKKVAALLQGSA